MSQPQQNDPKQPPPPPNAPKPDIRHSAALPPLRAPQGDATKPAPPPLKLDPRPQSHMQPTPGSAAASPARSPDADKLRHILDGRRSCVLIPTFEEDHVMELITETAVELGHSMKVWSYSRGVRDWLVADAKPIKDTEPPAAGLYYLLCEATSGVTVLQDITAHLDDARVLRLLRDLIERVNDINGHLILLDHSENGPDVIAAQVTRFEVSLPDERELVNLIFSTVQKEKL